MAPITSTTKKALLALLTVGMTSLAPAWGAKRPPPAPQITAFQMDAVQDTKPGTELFFRTTGTPGARATVRVGGLNRTIVLQEVDDGTYEGAYTLRPADRVAPTSAATVTLRRNGVTSSSTIRQVAQVVAAPPPRPATLAIARFSAAPVERMGPGTELRFTVEGTPGAHATFAIGNIATNLPMREVAPGRYEGSYTIRRQDHVGPDVPIVAALAANGAVARANVERTPLNDSTPPVVRDLTPREGETVAASGAVTVSGRFFDRGGMGVDPRSVRIVVGNRDVTAQSEITPESFTFRSTLPPGRYTADVTARDRAGNAMRSAWSFAVGNPGTVSGAVDGFPLEVTNVANNGTVPQGPIRIEGRTAPGATVDAQVTASTAAGGPIGVAQRVFSERIVADHGGRFGFTFDPQLQIAGTRYDVALHATRGDRRTDTQLTLLQQR